MAMVVRGIAVLLAVVTLLTAEPFDEKLSSDEGTQSKLQKAADPEESIEYSVSDQVSVEDPEVDVKTKGRPREKCV